MTERAHLLDLRYATFQPVDELHWPGDPPQMTSGLDWLIDADIPVCRVSAVQLKIGPLNFYPVSGTLHFDSERRMRERGLSGLRAVLEGATGRELPPIR